MSQAKRLISHSFLDPRKPDVLVFHSSRHAQTSGFRMHACGCADTLPAAQPEPDARTLHPSRPQATTHPWSGELRQKNSRPMYAIQTCRMRKSRVARPLARTPRLPERGNVRIAGGSKNCLATRRVRNFINLNGRDAFPNMTRSGSRIFVPSTAMYCSNPAARHASSIPSATPCPMTLTRCRLSLALHVRVSL